MHEAIFEQVYPIVLSAVGLRAAARHLGPWDREDAEQQAALGVWRALPRFDPARGCLRTFVECVARNESVTARRGNWQPEHEPLEGLESVLIAPDSRPDLRADVDRVLDTVAPFAQAVARGLVDYNATETSRHLGVSRAATYRAIGRLRLAFMSAGLRPASHRHRARGARR
jgi:DNA-directed RNA polymerase specialized sigma24 family protein